MAAEHEKKSLSKEQLLSFLDTMSTVFDKSGMLALCHWDESVGSCPHLDMFLGRVFLGSAVLHLPNHFNNSNKSSFGGIETTISFIRQNHLKIRKL